MNIIEIAKYIEELSKQHIEKTIESPYHFHETQKQIKKAEREIEHIDQEIEKIKRKPNITILASELNAYLG